MRVFDFIYSYVIVHVSFSFYCLFDYSDHAPFSSPLSQSSLSSSMYAS